MARAIGRVAIVGLGLIGSSVARAIKAKLPDMAVTGQDADLAQHGTRNNHCCGTRPHLVVC